MLQVVHLVPIATVHQAIAESAREEPTMQAPTTVPPG